MNADDVIFEGVGIAQPNESPNSAPTMSDTPLTEQEGVSSMDGKPEVDNINKSTEGNTESNTTQAESNDDNSSTGGLNQGDSVEFNGVTYTVSEKGDLVDSDGKVFKSANELNAWLKEVNVEDKTANDSTEFDIASIQEALGINIIDESGNTVEFTNDAAGVNAYVNSVIDLKTIEVQQATINKLFMDNPLLKQFNDYVTINGTSAGFGNIPDRSGIVIDKDNKTQQAAIIRMAAQEFGNKSFNDNYIKYLADSGALYDEAKNQLEALIAKDEEYKRNIEQQAELYRQEQQSTVNSYWDKVKEVVSTRKIGAYTIPENFTKQVNGQKVIVTPNDFYDYLSKPNQQDSNGNNVTGYQRDLDGLSPEEYLNRELLDAWLLFTGGTYKDLIDMAVKEDKVRQLKIKSKEQRATKSVKVIRKSSGKVDFNDIVF